MKWFVVTIGGVVRISQGLKSYGEDETNVTMLRDSWETAEKLLKNCWETAERQLRDSWDTAERLLSKEKGMELTLSCLVFPAFFLTFLLNLFI